MDLIDVSQEKTVAPQATGKDSRTQLFPLVFKLLLLFLLCVIVSEWQKTTAQVLSDVVRWNNGKAYLLYESGQYIRYDVAADRADEGYPKQIAGNWPGVWENNIDAALLWNNGKAYFFKGTKYIRYDVAADKADAGYPADISAHWKGLWDRDIDAAVMWNDGNAYFFKGENVIQYSVSDDAAKKIFKIRDRFPGLWERDIDAAVLWNNGKAFFFKGNRYLRFDVASNKVDAEVKPVAGNWPGVGDNQAAHFGWRGSADTNLLFSQFFPRDHTVMARFLLQYPYAYAGPVLGENGNGTYVVGQGNFDSGHEIDAAILVPATPPFPSTKAYFFKGDTVVRYDIAGDKADDGYPRPIRQELPGVWERDIDAAVVWPNGKIYFFKGSKFIRYDFFQRKVEALLDIKDHWKGLWERDIDAALLWPTGKVYFFKGDKYIRYDIASDQAEATLTIKDHWKNLWARDISAALLWDKKKAYFFKGGKYCRYDVANDEVDEDYPMSISERWAGLMTNRNPMFTVAVGSKKRNYTSSELFGKWVHVALVRSGNTFTLFLNGQKLDPPIVVDPADPLIPRGRTNLRLGRRTDQPAEIKNDEDNKTVNGTEAQFYGLIDDVAVFDKALTQQEINQIRVERGRSIDGNEPHLIAGWNFDEVTNPPQVIRDSRIFFKSGTPGMHPSGITLVSQARENSVDLRLLPLPFQRVNRQLPFKPNQVWFIEQGMNDPDGSHHGYAAFSIDFTLIGPETAFKVVNPNDGSSSCGEAVLASAAGSVTKLSDKGRGEGEQNDFDGPNEVYVQHAPGEMGSYAHMFTGSATESLGNLKRGQPTMVNQGQRVGTVGTLNGCHLHVGVFEHKTSDVNFPQQYNNYEVSDDDGSTWRRVERGTPKAGQRVRRPAN